MRICLATTEFPPFYSGGISTYYRNLCRGLADNGCEVCVLTRACDAADSREDSYDNVCVVRTRPTELREVTESLAFVRHLAPMTTRTIASALVITAELIRLHAQERFDIVESPEIQCLNSAIHDSGGLNDLPKVVALHGSHATISRYDPIECDNDDREICRQLERSSVLSADGIITSTPNETVPWDVDRSVPICPVLPPFSGTVVCKSVDANASLPETYALVVGRLQSWKGIADLADAFKIIAKSCPDLHVVSVGADTKTGPGGQSMRVYLERQLGELWLSRWHWMSDLSPSRLASVRQGALFAVCPSRWESFGYSVPEAMYDGIPVIVSSGAGSAGIVHHGKDALVFASGNCSQLGDKMTRLYQDRDLRARLAGNSRSTVAQQLDLRATSAARIEIYRRIISRFDSERRNIGYGIIRPFTQLLTCMQSTEGRKRIVKSFRAQELVNELARKTRKRMPH